MQIDLTKLTLKHDEDYGEDLWHYGDTNLYLGAEVSAPTEDQVRECIIYRQLTSPKTLQELIEGLNAKGHTALTDFIKQHGKDRIDNLGRGNYWVPLNFELEEGQEIGINIHNW